MTKRANILRERRDSLHRGVRPPSGAATPECARLLNSRFRIAYGNCCARGRAHPAVAHPTDWAIQTSRCWNRLCRSGRLLLVCWLAAAVIKVSGADAPAAKTNIVIGLLVPPGETFGASIRDGAQIAVDQANRTDGKKVRLVVRGRVGQWGADAEEAARMVLDDGATALITPPDGAASHLVLQVSGRTAVPVVSLCPDSSVSRAGVPWFARVVPRTTDQARALFSHFSNGSSPVRRWLALVPPGRAGREVSIDLKTAALMSGCFLEQTIEIMSTNADSRVTQALSTNTAGILVWLDPKPAALCVKTLQRAGFSGAVAGPVWLHAPEFVALAGDSLEGFVLPGLLLGEASQQRFNAFEIVFRDKFKHQPDIMAAFGFDAAALLVQVLRSTEPENLPRAFPLDFTLPGVTGLLNFDAEGNRKTALQLLVFERDGFVPLR